MKQKRWWWLGGVLGTFLSADVLGRAMGYGALGPGEARAQRVALTFDDGPSEQTESILQVLEKYGAKSTFFVTEPACRAFPAQLNLIRQAGHQLEAHGRWHVHALRLPIWREWAQVQWHPRSRESGPHLYRPPYGGHSPFTRLLAHLNGREVALWDVESRDWTAADPHELARQTLQKVRGGSVILLHDQFTITPVLLDELLSGLTSRGFKAVKFNDLPPRRITLKAGLGRLRQSYGG